MTSLIRYVEPQLVAEIWEALELLISHELEPRLHEATRRIQRRARRTEAMRGKRGAASRRLGRRRRSLGESIGGDGGGGGGGGEGESSLEPSLGSACKCSPRRRHPFPTALRALTFKRARRRF